MPPEKQPRVETTSEAGILLQAPETHEQEEATTEPAQQIAECLQQNRTLDAESIANETPDQTARHLQLDHQMEMAEPSSSNGDSSSSSSSSRKVLKRKIWGGLWNRRKHLGVFIIDQQHKFYLFTCMIKEGLAAAVQNTIDNPIPTELSEDDYQFEVAQIHKDFRMKTFAGLVFASLRRSLGITEKEYQQAVSCEGCYLQFISNSKSKANFFLTNDKQFFLKTQSKREIRFLLSHLKLYIEHLENYPHSLLVKILGVHSLTFARQKKYFIVMQNVFHPDERIIARYDIKGCEVSRWMNPEPEGSQVIIVLKDLNFEGNFIELEEQRAWLKRQVEIDLSFLRKLNVLDYSLVLGHQPLHHDERQCIMHLATIVMRTKKSTLFFTCPVADRSVNARSSHIALPGEVSDNNSTIQGTELNAGMSQCQKTETSQAEIRVENNRAFKVGSELTQLCQAQNRRLLPNFKTPIHVIDGPEHRYFIGITDIFTVYSFKKRLEHLWKKLRYPGKSFSTVSPSVYCQRLCKWVENHTK